MAPKGVEPGREEPAELLHPPPGSRAVAAHSSQRRVGLVTPKYLARASGGWRERPREAGT